MINIAVVIAATLATFIFMFIFYRDSIGFGWLVLKSTFEFITALNLWPIAIVAIIFSGFPRRQQKQRQ